MSVIVRDISSGVPDPKPGTATHDHQFFRRAYLEEVEEQFVLGLEDVAEADRLWDADLPVFVTQLEWTAALIKKCVSPFCLLQ